MKFILKKSRTGAGRGIASSLVSSILSARSHFFSYFSSKFLILKKSFTLVELSIVLLVLALLVSTLLVGRQIIDRAKVQQVISEIDYYTKNFQMFRDQYDFLPGGLGEETCRKYPEFSMQKGDEPTKYSTQCDDPVSMRGGSATKTYTSYQQANFSMVDMVVSGMAENRSPGERIRKKFDIAEKEETNCVQIPAVRGGYYRGILCDDNHYIGEIDYYKWRLNFHYCEDKNTMVYVRCVDSSYRNGEDVKCNYKMSNKMKGKNQSATGYHNCLVIDNNITLWTCDFAYNLTLNLNDYYFPLSTWGLSLHEGEMATECETKTIPGEPRFGYLLKQDEIENQANRASFDSKTWITYSGGKVNYAMIYGVGKDNLFSAAEENSIIVFFHFDPDKGELADDGAVSYALYDLMIKKLGEKKDQSIGNIIPLNKSAGEGFNFAYIMR